MPKNPSEVEKISYIRKFADLTWEAVRRNPDYQRDYRRLLENYGLTPEDVKPKKLDGSTLVPFHPAREKTGYFDFHERRYAWEGEDEAPDPDKCNLSYMLTKWGFACDPDELPYGPSWAKASGFISKDWRKRHRTRNSMPDLLTSLDLKNLPGVLEVEKFPKVYLNHPDPEKAMHDALNQGRKEGYLTTFNRLPWEVENPANLTVTINLQAPSQLIRYALEFLVEVCKSELKIPDKKIEAQHIKKCFQIYSLYQEGYSEEYIADQIDLTHYKKEEAMRDGLDDYLKDWGVPQVKRCLNDAEKMIKKGNII